VFDVCPGTTYNISAWVLSGVDNGCQNHLEANDVSISPTVPSYDGVFNDWSPIHGTFVAGPDEYAIVTLYTICNGASPTLTYWDDVLITPVTAGTVRKRSTIGSSGNMKKKAGPLRRVAMTLSA
jgi:hypothetical protein